MKVNAAKRNGEGYPVIRRETALVFQKRNGRTSRSSGVRKCFAIIEPPSGGSSPGRQLFEKQLEYVTFDAKPRADEILVLTKGFLVAGQTQNVVWCGDHARKARERREWAYEMVQGMVVKWGLGAGDEVALHVTDRYARYLQQRLKTVGTRPSIPTARCNMGQKLRWYTERIGGQV